MDRIFAMLETYLLTLVHPFRIHQNFRFRLPLPNHGGHVYEPLTLAESLGLSWVFAILRGLFRIVVLNFFLLAFLRLQGPQFEFLQEMAKESGYSTYYFFLFSAALDIIFFPIGALVFTELWAMIIRRYAVWLNPELPSDEIADQITTHALSANVLSIVPFLGDLVQVILYYFLLYAGLRANLGASRSLSLVILMTPTLIFLMGLSLLGLMIFYLVA
jgi:hypothetical protein